MIITPDSPIESIAACDNQPLNPKPYLEGQRDLTSKLIVQITKVITWAIRVSNLLTKSP